MKEAIVNVNSNMNKKSGIKEVFNKPVVRALVHALIDIAIGVYTAVIREWNGVAWCILIMLILLDLFVITYYGTQTINYRASISKLQEANERLVQRVRCCDNLIKSMGKSCDATVDKASDVINDARSEDGHPSMKTWNFSSSCKGVTEKIHSIIKGYLQNSASCIEVNYDRVFLNKSENARKIQTIACSTDECCKPSIYGKVRDVNTDSYLDSQYVRDGDYDLKSYTKREDVKLVMKNCQHTHKYNQLYLVPVLCRQKKLIGVLVISCLHDTCLAPTDDEAKAFIRSTIEPYLKLLVVFYKLEIVFGLQPVYEV